MDLQLAGPDVQSVTMLPSVDLQFLELLPHPTSIFILLIGPVRLCAVFDVTRSCYYAHRLRRRSPDVERLRLRSRVNELFTHGRSAAGSRSIVSMMQEDGEQIGRFKVRGLMRELELVSKQPGSHAYNQAMVERPDIPNILNREFDVLAPNQVWCGDITYIWAQGKWHYLAVVMDLLRAPSGGLGAVEQAGCGSGHQGVGHGLRTAWKASRLLFHSDQGRFE